MTRAVGRVFARIRSPEDARDRAFLMAAPTKPLAPTAERTWAFGVEPFDQGALPQCVAYAWTANMLAAPIITPTGAPASWAAWLYGEAQKIDRIPGAHDGTTVRAAAQVLKASGKLASYVWGETAHQVAAHLYTRGPVVLGTNWYAGMSDVTRGAGATMHGTGRNEGGHAYLAIGISMPRRAIRVLNSWGSEWGDRGRAWMPLALLDRLLSEDGEACSALEVG